MPVWYPEGVKRAWRLLSKDMAAPAPTWILGKLRSCCVSGVGLPGTWVVTGLGTQAAKQGGWPRTSLQKEQALLLLWGPVQAQYIRGKGLCQSSLWFLQSRGQRPTDSKVCSRVKSSINNLAVLGSQVQKKMYVFFLRMIRDGKASSQPLTFIPGFWCHDCSWNESRAAHCHHWFLSSFPPINLDSGHFQTKQDKNTANRADSKELQSTRDLCCLHVLRVAVWTSRGAKKDCDSLHATITFEKLPLFWMKFALIERKRK